MKLGSRCMQLSLTPQAQSSITGANAVVVARQPATVWCSVNDTGSEQPSG